MTPLTANLIQFLSFGNIILNIAALVLLASLIFPNKPWAQKLNSFLNTHVLTLIFSLTLIATLGSLYLSEVALFNPCKYCWIQRIFMYPLVILSWIALIKKDFKCVRDYILSLSIIGAVIAGYHYFLQFGPVEAKPCSVVGYYEESCADKLFVEFGYVTIPMMAFSIFVTVILLILINKKADK